MKFCLMLQFAEMLPVAAIILMFIIYLTIIFYFLAFIIITDSSFDYFFPVLLLLLLMFPDCSTFPDAFCFFATCFALFGQFSSEFWSMIWLWWHLSNGSKMISETEAILKVGSCDCDGAIQNLLRVFNILCAVWKKKKMLYFHDCCCW